MPKISLEEMQRDLADTESDITALSNIVGGLDTFITRNGGEDRSAFKMDRLKYLALLEQARSLKKKIQSAITDAQNDTVN